MNKITTHKETTLSKVIVCAKLPPIKPGLNT